MKKNNNIQMPNHPFKTAQDVKRYVRDILLQVQQEETLKKIIDITSKIDYAVIYHLDDDEALARLYELREKKKTGGLSEEEWKELWSLEPDDEIKYIILIEELLGNADVFNLVVMGLNVLRRQIVVDNKLLLFYRMKIIGLLRSFHVVTNIFTL